MLNRTNYSSVLFFLLTIAVISPKIAHAQQEKYWVDTDEEIVKQYPRGIFSAKLPSGAYGNSIRFGNVIVEREQTISMQEDPTFDFIPLLSGGFVTLSNVSIFEKYDANARLINTLSNSSGSALGEGVSEWYTNEEQSLWILTNPLIKTAQGEGSAASIWDGEQTKNLVYSATDKIETVGISKNGLFTAVVTASRAGGEGMISVFDRQANELLKVNVDTDFEAIGLKFSNDNEYIILYSTKRAIVYGLPSGKKYGSTSFRTTLIDVELDTSSLTLYALTGNLGQEKLTDIEVRKVDFKAGKMAKNVVEKELTRVHPTLAVQLKSNSEYIYISGVREMYKIN